MEKVRFMIFVHIGKKTAYFISYSLFVVTRLVLAARTLNPLSLRRFTSRERFFIAKGKMLQNKELRDSQNQTFWQCCGSGSVSF